MKRILIQIATCLILLVSSLTSLSAQIIEPEGPGLIPPGTAIIDNQRAATLDDDSSTSSLVPSEDCVEIVNAFVYVTNMEGKHDEVTSGFFYPPGATPIFLGYEIAGQSGVIEVPESSFIYDGMIDPESELQIYEARVEIPLNVATTCQSISGSTSVTYNIFLASDNSGTPYPFILNSYPDGLFSCLVFCDACADLPSSVHCINSQYFNRWTGAVAISCSDSDCEIDSPEDIGIGNSSFSNGKNPTTSEERFSNGLTGTEIPLSSEYDLTISPNPVRLSTNISFQSEHSEEIEISIFDATGKEVYYYAIKTEVGSNTLNIKTDFWKEGIYFGLLKSKSTTQAFKLLKL